MIIALEKRRENVAEYILYMWQVEDIIRALELDPERIREYVKSGYDVEPALQEQIYHWYRDIADQMVAQQVVERGHISELEELMAQLEETSSKLLRMPSQMLYSALYFKTLPSIIQLRELSGGTALGEVETCFVGIYGYLTLKAKDEKVSEQTEESIKQFSTFLAMLADRFREVEEGHLVLLARDEVNDEEDFE